MHFQTVRSFDISQFESKGVDQNSNNDHVIDKLLMVSHDHLFLLIEEY